MAIVAAKLQRLQRQLGELVEKAHATVVEALFWPALLGYGEAALAYATVRTSRAATWGVRLGWLAQTALLAAQVARADGFPWSSWAGSLNLFVWLVVGAYLIWGCRPRYRLLGLAVMPLAAILFVVARIGGGTRAGAHSTDGNLFLALHVGFVLAAFAGFTLAAGARGGVPLAGASAEAPRGRHPAAAPAAARRARAAHVAHDRACRCRSSRSASSPASCASATAAAALDALEVRHAAHLARLRRLPRAAARPGAAPPTSPSAASRS